MKDIIISYGHSAIGGKDTGAKGYKSTENVLIRKYLKPYINKGLKAQGVTYTNVSEKKKNYVDIKDQWAHGKPTGYRKAISIHLNAYNNKAVGAGVKTFSKNFSKGNKLAKAMADVLGTTNRGAEYQNLYMLRELDYDYLLEPCFCDAKSDFDKFIDKHEELAEVIVKFICDILGKDYSTKTKTVIKDTYPRHENRLASKKYTKLKKGTIVKVYRETKNWSYTNYNWIFKKRLK